MKTPIDRVLSAGPDANLAASSATALLGTAEAIEVMAGEVSLPGELVIPPGARGLVVFVHGSGRRRLLARDAHVARVLERASLATLRFDLLTSQEESDDADGHLGFDIGLLAGRLLAATEWIRRHEATADLPVGYFGESTGAAAALLAAAWPAARVSAVVSGGGRPDLAEGALARVRAPTLLIVGSQDDIMLQLNREALARLQCPRELAVVGGATQRFEEPGALDHAAALAAQWFRRHLHA